MLKDKVVLITGVTRGLGKSLTQAFLNEGCKVIGFGRSQSALTSLSDDLNDDSFYPFCVDVADANSVQQKVAEAIQTLKCIDYVFNNAAVYPNVSILDESAESFAHVMQVNVCGIANVCKSVLPNMIDQQFGRIYNLGSFADKDPIANSAAYSASKGAVHALTMAIARDIENLNLDIHIHEWIPGHLKTDMGSSEGIEPSLSASWAVQIVKGEIPASSKNVLFMNNQEFVPAKSFKQKIKDKLKFLG